jgi:hypothetical protein
MQIAQDVVSVLSQSRVDSYNLYLPPVQLDRKLYLDVNKCLELIGGKWNRTAKAHLFSSNPSDLLDEMINTGEVVDSKKEFDFFETPKEIVKRMLAYANIQRTDILLEPSAGHGAIYEEFPQENERHAVELNKESYDILMIKNLGGNIRCADFLDPKHYYNNIFPIEVDKIIMNPPFSKQQDVKHIFQAYDILKKGGRLVSIVSESPFFRENKLSQSFREWLFDLKDNNSATIYDLDKGTFKESGTMVKTRIIVVDKP